MVENKVDNNTMEEKSQTTMLLIRKNKGNKNNNKKTNQKIQAALMEMGAEKIVIEEEMEEIEIMKRAGKKLIMRKLINRR